MQARVGGGLRPDVGLEFNLKSCKVELPELCMAEVRYTSLFGFSIKHVRIYGAREFIANTKGSPSAVLARDG
jgi:hypothetical protein